jgi:hypothetical protein
MSESYLDELLDELVPAGSRDGWDDVLRRARRSQRRYVALVVAVAALVLAPATWAAWRVFEGTPAPRSVKRVFVASNRTSAAFAQRFGTVLPLAVVSKAHGVVQVHTRQGLFDLYAAPATNGGTCFLTGYERDAQKSGLLLGGEGGCIGGKDPIGGEVPPIIAGTNGSQSANGVTYQTIFWGYAKGSETTVQVAFANGTKLTLPVVEHFFLAALREDSGVVSIVGRDAAGNLIARCDPGTTGGKPCGYGPPATAP